MCIQVRSVPMYVGGPFSVPTVVATKSQGRTTRFLRIKLAVAVA